VKEANTKKPLKRTSRIDLLLFLVALGRGVNVTSFFLIVCAKEELGSAKEELGSSKPKSVF